MIRLGVEKSKGVYRDISSLKKTEKTKENTFFFVIFVLYHVRVALAL